MPSGATKKTKWALSLVILLAITIFFSIVIFFATRSQNSSQTLEIGGHHLNIELAESRLEKQRGLCCRDSLDKNSGMLFVYERPGEHGFWMKDTRIPLDMIWLDENKIVVHIERSVHPESYPKVFNSPSPAQYILETNAGWSEAHDIQPGDQASF